MNYISYGWQLFKLNRKRDGADKSLSRMIEEARKKGGEEAANETYQTESFELRIIEAEIPILVTRYLADKANKKLLPIPPMNKDGGYWELSHEIGKWHLTNKGITELRKLIREDSKELRESVYFWISILFGLLGLIIGLISVIK